MPRWNNPAPHPRSRKRLRRCGAVDGQGRLLCGIGHGHPKPWTLTIKPLRTLATGSNTTMPRPFDDDDSFDDLDDDDFEDDDFETDDDDFEDEDDGDEDDGDEDDGDSDPAHDSLLEE
jgi:hypothetical protein